MKPHPSQSTSAHSSYPVNQKFVLRIAVALVVGLALMLGYSQSQLYIWRENNIKILEKFEVNTTKELLNKRLEIK